MPTIFNIIEMHRSQELREQLRADAQRRANERAEGLKVTDRLQELMTAEDYDLWWEAAPEENFFDAARAKLAQLQSRTPEQAASDQIARDLHENWDAIPEVEF